MSEALEHPYVADLHDPLDEPVCDRPFSLNIKDEELTEDDLRVGLVCGGEA